MKVALVHEWLTTFGGSEQVVEEILKMFPHAELFAVCDFLRDADREKLGGRAAKTTFIQRLPFARTRYRSYLPLMPVAIEQLDVTGFDLVISSSHAVAKGVITGPAQVHVCYIHSPMRYAWDLQFQYLSEGGLNGGLKGLLARWLLHKIRMWDVRTANGVDVFVANSTFIANRVRKIYRREAKIVHPPVAVDKFVPAANKEDFFVTASRLVPYKRIDLIVGAFAEMRDRELVVIGDGPEMKKIREIATPNVKILGYQPQASVIDYMQRAKAFVFAAEEDFGIVPVEAQACGTPVIAYGRGGALDSVLPAGSSGAPTGLFFEQQSVPSIKDAVRRFDQVAASFSASNCRLNAEKFSPQAFHSKFLSEIEAALGHRPSGDGLSSGKHGGQ